MIGEKHHAFLSCAFYSVLCDELGQERGEEAFRFAVRRYAHECGVRMAQRAMRDGRPTDWTSFLRYREWEFSALELGQGVSATPDDRYTIAHCPWHDQFLSLPRCGAIFCRTLHAAMAYGFDPALKLVVEQTLSEGDQCVFCLQGAKTARQETPSSADLRDWNYHCGHLLAVDRQVAHNVLGNEQILTHRVGQLFSREFGQRALHELEQAARADFIQV